jgi:hypothetical protein
MTIELHHKLRRLTEAQDALSMFGYDSPEGISALATMKELRDCILVARDSVSDPDGKEYTVSTANRQSSAIANAGNWYAETIVWRLDDPDDRKNHESWSMVWQGSATAGSDHTHRRAVELVKSGRIELTDGGEE